MCVLWISSHARDVWHKTCFESAWARCDSAAGAQAANCRRICGGGRQLIAVSRLLDYPQKETAMSSIVNLTNTPSLLQQLNVPSHAHRKGSPVHSSDDTGDTTAARVPASTVKNSFGSVLESLEQLIGLKV